MQEISRIDEKGRLLIPSGIRKSLGLDASMEVVISLEGKVATLSPVFDKKVYEMRVIMGDAPGSLAKIAELLSREDFDIIISESRSLEREKKAEWSLTGKYDGDFKALACKLKRLDFVSNVITK
jgi:bifunctional DNA-binding transcriptional regulator/antitoxin component of YhaV-PrlF toxin-antitoxin module